MQTTDPLMLATARFIRRMSDRGRFEETCKVTAEIVRWRDAMTAGGFAQDVLVASLLTVAWTTVLEAGAEPETVFNWVIEKAMGAV